MDLSWFLWLPRATNYPLASNIKHWKSNPSTKYICKHWIHFVEPCKKSTKSSQALNTAIKLPSFSPTHNHFKDFYALHVEMKWCEHLFRYRHVYFLSDRKTDRTNSAICSISFCSHQIQFSVFRNIKCITSFTPVWFVGRCKRYHAYQALCLAGRKGKKLKVKVV